MKYPCSCYRRPDTLDSFAKHCARVGDQEHRELLASALGGEEPQTWSSVLKSLYPQGAINNTMYQKSPMKDLFKCK